MTIFGLRIMTESQHRADRESLDALMEVAAREIEILKVKYQYAKARAIVAEQFQRKTIVTVKPVAMGVDSGVRIEVGVKPETEIREV